MRTTASWFGLRSDRIQVRGAMACADYGMGQLETKPDLMRPMVSGNPWPETGHLTGQESSSSYIRLPPEAWTVDPKNLGEGLHNLYIRNMTTSDNFWTVVLTF
jgi:hypothetical protein